MPQKRFYFFLLIMTVIFAVSIFFLQKPSSLQNNTTPDKTVVQIKNTDIAVEIADTAEERNRGLSGRDVLAENAGMLFIFETEGIYAFWMKDMRFPIDIIWITKDLSIADITKNLSPDTFPNSVSPAHPAQYVLEVNAGFADMHNMTVGDAVMLPIHNDGF